MLLVMLAGPALAAAQDSATDAVPAGQSAQDSTPTPAGGAAGTKPAPLPPGPGGKRMTASPTSVAPVLDGRVDEEVWGSADRVTDFLQREPVEAAPASERTEARILYDEQYLYIGLIMFDRDPSAIIAQDLRRDSSLGADDSVTVIFDTFHDHRNGFMFRVNALGTKYDATVRNEREINSSWDEKWESAATLTERGWEAELRIPLKVLRYRTGTHIWGVDFERQIRRRNEEVAWANYRQDFELRNVSQAGHLLGLQDLSLTDRFRFKPYLSGGYTALGASELPVNSGSGDIGLEDFKVQLSPNLTADLTINTDFAQVENDQERVNLTRFPLFFPERREFFLEGADKFNFGGSGGGGRGPTALIYNSRNIGLYDGSPVPMYYGAKMTGKLGSTSVGFINSQTGGAPEVEYGGRNYSALRLAQDVLERSQIGIIVTNVQDGSYFNRVGGIDANFRFGDYVSVGGYAAIADDSEVEGQRWIGNFDAGYNSDLWAFNARMNYIQEDFNPELGFLRRDNVILHNYSAGWKPRPAGGWLRQMRNYYSFEYATDVGGRILEREHRLSSRWQLNSGDSASFSLSRGFERLTDGFSPIDDVEILPGDYDVNRWRISFDSFRARKVSFGVGLGGGGYYDGTRSNVDARVTVRFNEKFSLTPSYDLNRVELPGGAFSTHVVSARASYNFNDQWLTSALVQYNSVAERMSVFARLNYIFRPGDDFFLVYKSTLRYDPEFYGQSDQALIAKLTRSWDF